MVTAVMKLKDAYSLEEKYDQPRQHIKKQRCHFGDKGPYSEAMVFPVVMYGREGWTMKRLSAKESMLSNCGPGEDS